MINQKNIKETPPFNRPPIRNKKFKYSILVSTCDAYSDCWDPFFKLFSVYWPDFEGKIYLNTEYKDYSYGDLNIVPIKCCEVEPNNHDVSTPWGVRFKRALETMDEDIILYMQDDYFLKNYVKNDIVENYAQLMIDNNDIDCIHLTDQALTSNGLPTKYKGLTLADLNQRYRTCLQAALWKKNVLIEYIREYESIWHFEEFGSKRGQILKHNFYVVDGKWVKLNHFEIMPYVFTGITQGRWKEDVVPLFEKHDIKINFKIRGFINDTPKKTIKDRFMYKINRIPILINNYKDLRNLKLQQYKTPKKIENSIELPILKVNLINQQKKSV